MTRLRDRFATLDRQPMPDLWPDVERRLARLAVTQPAPSVAVRGPVRRTGGTGRGLSPLLAGLLIVALAGTVAVGSGLVRLPAVVTDPTPSDASSPLLSAPQPSDSATTPQPSFTQQPSEPPVGAGSPWIVFQANGGAGSVRDTRLWAMRADGSELHQIRAGNYMTVAWSRDGSRLLLNDGRLRMASVAAKIGPFVDTGIVVPEAAQWEAFDFAPDGGRVVFVQRDKCPRGSAGAGGIVLAVYVAETAGANCWVLATVDLRTGQRVELGRTLVKDQTRTENRALELPAWSPDGTKIAYAIVDEAHGTSELWIVHADGSNPAKVDLGGSVPVSGPRWSPDGTRIAFTSQSWLSASESDSAIAVVELATGHLERLTIGPDPATQHVCCAEWIDRTHLRVQGAGPDDATRFWAAAVDGGAAQPQVIADLANALAASDPPLRPSMRSAPGDPGRTFFWQPVGG